MKARRFAVVIGLASLLFPAYASAANIVFVQANYAAPQSSPTTVSVTYTAAQTAGNLNVIAVGWNNSTTTVASVADSKGNIYALAVGPTVVSGALSQSIYYAKNIVAAAAGTNAVTVTFSAATAFPDIRILEYAGADLVSPVDVTAAATGSGGTANSGAATTTNATDLIFSANMTTNVTAGPGSGFTQRILTVPDSDIAEDRMVTTIGSYSATAPTSGQWIMQMVAFRTPGSVVVDTQPPTAPSNLTATAISGTQINLSWTASTDNIGVTNYLIERCQGVGCSTFLQIATSAVTSYSDSPLTNGTSYSYRVRATDAAPNLSGYSAVATRQTIDTQAPSTPATLTATANGGSQINLSWPASTDNVGVTGYLLERCQGAGCVTFLQIAAPTATTFIDTGLTPGTTYLYRVRATDAASNFSGYAGPASATTTAPDTQAPTDPSNLTATPASGTQINLSWTGSTDNIAVTNYLVERCQGASCTVFGQIGTSATPTYNDSTVANATTYKYQVRATDAAGNFSGYAGPASATTPDTQAPIAPAGLTTTVISGTQINLSWTASTDNVGVTGYQVERCQNAGCSIFTQIATPTATTFNDTGLTNGISYSYRVRATDAAANLGPYSSVSTALTTDTQAPTAPSTLTATTVSTSQINLSWTASTDNVAVTSYLVESCQGAGCAIFAQIGTSTGITFSNTGLTNGTSYSYRVRATDAASNASNYSNTATASTSAVISGLVAAYSFNEGSGTTLIDLSGNNLNGTIVGATWTTGGKYGNALSFNGSSSYVDLGNPAALQLTGSMTLEAWVNAAANPSDDGQIIAKSNGPGWQLKTTPDTGPHTFGVKAYGSTSAQRASAAARALNTWYHVAGVYNASAGTLDIYVNGVLNNGVLTGTIPASQLNQAVNVNIGRRTGGFYFNGIIDEMRIYNRALSQVELQIDMNTALGSAPPPPDTTPPSAPANLAGTPVSGTQINLSWAASTDNVGVTNYLVERCLTASCTFAQIGTATGLSYGDTGLAAGTGYSYRVKATDAAGNLSAYSNVVNATTLAPDTESPTTPTNLTATPVSGSQINLSWTGSTDNIGVTGYLIERCTGVGCNNFARQTTVAPTNYSDTGLIPNTSYTYQVKATDAAGNFSPYSNQFTVSTLGTITGLVAAYSFNEGSGTTLTDISGNNLNGTIVGATWTTGGKYGNGLSFNGSSSYVDLGNPAALQLTGSMTIEAWIKAAADPGDDGQIVAKSNGSAGWQFKTSPDTGPYTFGIAVSGTSSTTTQRYSTTTRALNTWYHVAGVYDAAAGTLSTYVNGVLDNGTLRGTIPASQFNQTVNVNIGRRTGGFYFNGIIDEVRIYNRTLNMTQIQADMGTPVGSGGTLPVAALDKASIAFGSRQTGTTSAASPVTLSNPGGAPLIITSIAMSGGNPADFAQTNNCGSSLTAGASCTINVTFTPTTTGARISTLTVTDNAAGTPHTVSLSGTGTGFQVTPRVAVLNSNQTQQFSASSGTVTWSVDGLPGGSTAAGTITGAGLYTPPTATGSHTVTATITGQSVSASSTVYISNYPGTFTIHNDNLRSGLNSNETVLTQSNVTQAQFGKLFTYPLDGITYASPLYVANVNIPGQGLRNVVYIATEHNSVYAFDADNLSSIPLWQKSFLGTGVTTVPCGDTGECGDILTEIGITGTPVIDQSTGTLYVVAKTKESGNYFQRLHALNITTGAEKFGGPVNITGSVAGSGSGTSGGQIPFSTLRENQRPGLALNNGVVYITWSSHGDQTPWHGWIMGYNATTLARTMIFCVSPDGYGGGIWQSGGAPGIDASGNVYFITGNGDFNANTGGRDYGDTVVKLGPTGTVVDYFTPFDQATLESGNYDLSSAGPTLLIDQPGAIPHLLITATKNGTIYVLNRDNMGHFQSGSNSQIVQSISNAVRHGGSEEGNYSVPVFFNNRIYFGAVSDTLKTFQFSNGRLSTSPTSQSSVSYPNRGASFAVSANGTSNGILWAMQDNNPSNGVLRAYDANNLATELYNTNQAGTRDTFGLATKFSIPLVVNGKVFIVSQQQLVVYGLLP